MHAAFSLIYYVYVMVRRYFHVLWLNINLYISQPLRLVPPTTPTRHRIVVVGDTWALGLGDWILAGQKAGIASSLAKAAALDRKAIRQRWYVINNGVNGTSTTSWLPPQTSKEQMPGEESGNSSEGKKKKNRKGEKKEDKEEEGEENGDVNRGGKWWNRTFEGSGVGVEAEIVVLMLGCGDVVQGNAGLPLHAMKVTSGIEARAFKEDEMANVVKNLRAIMMELVRRGKKVCVVDLPVSGAIVTKYGEGKMKRINRQIKQIVRAAGGEAEGITVCPLGSNYKVMKSEHRAFDGLHLNNKGYKVLGAEVYDKVKKFMIGVEWGTWKSQLKEQGMEEHETAMKMDAEEILNDNGVGVRRRISKK